MADFVIASLRGGANSTDPAIGLPEDQCILAQNVEFIDSMLGERRKGTTSVSLPAAITATDKVTFLHRHLPSDDETASELWILGVTGTASAVMQRKTTSWAAVTISDTPTLTGVFPFRWQGVSLHGKLFLAYKSNVDRLHVWDGTSMRRTGLLEPVAPTAADSGGAGTLSGTRYYRVRYTVQASGTTTRRSEPSNVLTFAPSGTNASITITKPATISEGETHWELEASLDNINFYILATTLVGTTTVVDSTSLNSGYAGGTLSEDIEDYALIPSPRYITADDDRLIWAGSYEQAALGSRVGWTPVYGAEGVGNDERFETDTDPFRDLDTYKGGIITGLSEPVLGAIWVFKQRGIYKLVRSGKRNSAYNVIKYSDVFGAIHGSVHSGVDSMGQPCVYFVDYEQGPCRIGMGGVKRCGEDLRATWQTLNIDATNVICSGLYYPTKKQMRWNLAVNAENVPSTAIVLHVDKSRDFADGIRKGWVVWTGNIAKALCMCLYADNIDDNAARSLSLVPLQGMVGLGHVQRCDTGTTDNTVAYTATITTKPYWFGSLLKKFQVKAAALCAKAIASSQITVKVLRDFNIETTSTITDKSLAATGTETDVIIYLDNLKGAAMRVAQFQFTDPTTVSAQWQLNRIDIREEPGQKA